MKTKRLLIVLFALVFSGTMMFGATAFAAQPSNLSEGLTSGSMVLSASAGPELTKVQKRFPSAKTVLEANNANFKSTLKDAGERATSSSPVIVHAIGAISISITDVPSNVILVGESTTSYNFNGSGASGQSILRMQGSIFGGVFNGGAKCDYDILVRSLQGSGVNGFIEDATFKSGRKYAIALTKKTRNVKISNCNISGVGDCGIHIVENSKAELIDNCTITNVGESGIDLQHAYAGTISNSVITNCKGHGISTDTGQKLKTGIVAGCTIDLIQNNKISNCVHHGIYVENKCTIKVMIGNKVFNNKKTGINITKGGKATGLKNNAFYGNKKSNLTASGKNATIALGAGNKSYNSKENGISISAGGKVTISGANNAIYNNAKNGINIVSSGSYLKITGKKTQVKKNKNNGISLNAKAKGSIANVVFSNNKRKAVYVGKKCKLTYKKCNVSKKGSKNRIYFA